MNVTMPDGTLVEGVPDDYSKDQVLALYEKNKAKPISAVGDELTTGENLLGGARSFVEGQTLGFGDEIGSGLAAIPASIISGEPYGETYDWMQKNYQKQQKEFERQNPKTALGLNIAGGLASFIPGAKKAMGTKFAQINPLKATAALSGTTGLIGGTGYAPTREEIPEYAGAGLVGGLALSPLGHYGGKLTGKGYGALKRAMTTETPRTTVSRTMGHYASMDELTPDDLIAASKLMGKEATLADVGGQNLKSLAMTMAQKGGKEKTKALESFAGRQKGATKRIMNSLRGLSGGDEKFFQNQKAIVDRRFKEASPLYEAAKKESLSTDDMVDFYNRSQSTVEGFEGIKGVLNKFTKGKGDHKTFKTSIKELHSLQKELRDEANAAFNKGRTERGNSLMKIQRDLIDTISEKNPNYAAGRKIWADESALNDAIKSGRNILKEDADFVSDNIASLSLSEQEAYINGAVKTIRDKLMGGRESSNTATKLASQLVRERLRGAFPDDQSFNKFINQLDIEDKYAQTYQKIYGGSQTQPRLEADSELHSVIKGKTSNVSIEGSDAITKATNAVRSVMDMDNIPQVVIDDVTRLMSTPVHKIPKKDMASLMKHGINKSDLNKIRGHISGAITSQITPQAQREMSR